MKYHIANKTLITVSVDAEPDEPIPTNAMITDGIREVILERLDDAIREVMSKSKLVKVAVSIDQLDINTTEEHETGEDDLQVFDMCVIV